MLPSSHRSPRNVAAVLEDATAETWDCKAKPLTKEAGIEVPANASLLAGAFSEFIAAAARLETSYGELQAQVAELGLELAERNAELNASLAENERMRAAVEQIVDSMPCGVLVIERDGALSRINPEGVALLGLGCAQAGSLHAVSRNSGLDLVSFVAGERDSEGEQEFGVDGEGGKRWIEVRTRRLYAGQVADADGWQQTILILRDVTAHKQAEQERERARRASSLAEIAAMLAHEIRNPLTSLELLAGLVAGSDRLAGTRGPELAWMSHMRAGIRSLSGTVNNVLSFHGAGFPTLAPLDLADALESSVEFVRPIAEQAGVRLSFHSERQRALVMGNAGALQQLVLNLVANAVRHTAKGGDVKLFLRRGGCSQACADRSRVRLEVSDTGDGIRPEQLEDIFRAGFSGSGNTSGLGLAVCSQIVRQHDGEIGVSETSPRGTTFFVELPAL